MLLAPHLAPRPPITQLRSYLQDHDSSGFDRARVPARGLCPVPAKLPEGITLEMLSVVADAVTTPFEAMRRAGLGADDVAVIVGAGGVGGFGVQIAAAQGAAVGGVDVDRGRLDLAAKHGAGVTPGAGAKDF